MKNLFILITFISFSCNNIKYAKCVSVHDGDSIMVLEGAGKAFHVRLAEIDCNELAQPHGLDAKHFTESLILGRMVKIVITGTDKYKRKIAKIYYKGRYINEEIVKAGYCYVYKPYSSRKLYNEYLVAKRNKVGLWACKLQEPPYKFRILHHKK